MEDVLNYLPYAVGAMAILLLCYAAIVLWGKNKVEQQRIDRIIKMKRQQEELNKGGGVSKTFWVDKNDLDPKR